MTPSPDKRRTEGERRGKPIIFSAPMVRALLAGTKTQTRRVLNPQPYRLKGDHVSHLPSPWNASGAIGGRIVTSDAELLRLHGWRVGDRLWVREAHFLTDNGHEELAVYAADDDAVAMHRAEVERMRESPVLSAVVDRRARLRPSIHLPRWASRLTLHVTDVRVQRLQEISNEDCLAEGIPNAHSPHVPTAGPTQSESMRKLGLISHYGGQYLRLWNSLHGPGAWDANPFVAALTFRVILANIDAPEAQPPHIAISPPVGIGRGE